MLPPPCPLSVTPIDFGRSEELIGRALRDAREFLDGGGEQRPPIRVRMHDHERRPEEVRPAPTPSLTAT